MASSRFARGNRVFPQHSILREIHSSRWTALFYGQIAFLQAATRRSMVEKFLAVTAWKPGTGSPTLPALALFERLTVAAIGIDAMILGSDEECDTAARRTRDLHARAGVTVEDTVFVLLCLADAWEASRSFAFRRLRSHEQGEFWEDIKKLGRLMGLAEADMPGDYREYQGRFVTAIAHPEIDEDCRQLVLDGVFYYSGVPMARAYRPFVPYVQLAIVANLRPRVRDAYGLRFEQSPALNVLRLLLRVSSRVMPRRSRLGIPNYARLRAIARVAQRRLAARS